MLKLSNPFRSRGGSSPGEKGVFGRPFPCGIPADQVELGCMAQISSLTALPFRGACTRSRVKDVAHRLQEATAR
jgi:hypothetical protein